MNVLPGGSIFIVFSGTDVFATTVPPTEPVAVRLAQAIVSTTGPNGRIVINYDCTPLPPCTGSGDVFQYTDYEGFTVIRFTGDCSWTAPDGLDEFEVLVVGGGGGGGFGEAAGGGGGGEGTPCAGGDLALPGGAPVRPPDRSLGNRRVDSGTGS